MRDAFLFCCKLNMRASELRLRNLIADPDGNIYYVSNLSLDIDDEYNELIGGVLLGKTSNEELREERELFWKPVDLTEEWLLKFGLEMALGCYNLVNNGWGVQIEVEDNIFSVQANREYQVAEIKYVHQLQNLYFALTGEELTAE